MHPITQNGYEVKYQAKFHPAQGRYYPVRAGGQMLSKLGRLLCFGQTHHELDMAGAHLAIALELLPELGSELPFTNVADARNFTKLHLGNTRHAQKYPNYYKDIWNIALNTQVSKVISCISKDNYFVPEPIKKSPLDARKIQAKHPS
jgi:hypothetical protein